MPNIRISFGAALALLWLPIQAQAADITVFAAASLKNALDQIAEEYQTRTGDHVLISYDGSSKLAKQIQQGAPVDVFISASPEWMDVLEADGLIQPATRRDLLGNDLVLIATGQVPAAQIGVGFDLRALLAGGKLSMAMVESVPAGQYGKAALESLGIWDSVAADIVQSENVRAALRLVTIGEAPYGIVYGSDAISDDEGGDKVSVVGSFPADSHPPILYPVAQMTGHDGAEVAAFMAELSSSRADEIFTGQGFKVLK